MTIKNSVFLNSKPLGFTINFQRVRVVQVLNSTINETTVTPMLLFFTTVFKMNDSKFTNNKGYKGGALYMIEVSLTIIVNCVFVNNSAENGGAIHYSAFQTHCYIINSTFVSNTANGLGGGVYFSSHTVDGGKTNELILSNVAFTAFSKEKYYSKYGHFLFSTSATFLANVSMKFEDTSNGEVLDAFACTSDCYKMSYFTNVTLQCPHNYETTQTQLKDLKSVSSLCCDKCPIGKYSFQGQTRELNTFIGRV